MISLDVVSLFTNIPNSLVKKCVIKKWREIKENYNDMAQLEFTKSKLKNVEKLTQLELEKIKYKPIVQKKFLDGLNIILNNCFLTFNNNTYRQIFGSPMGSPISPILADLVMEFIENEVLQKLVVKPLFYYRYVDDIIMVVEENEITNTLNMFNSFHNSLQFTIEIENDNKLPFLDTCLIRAENSELITDWYHKATWNGRYLNFNSTLPLSYKRNTVSIMVQKILKLSHPSFHQKNIDLLITTLKKNCYPLQFIYSEISKARNKYSVNVSNPVPAIVSDNTTRTTRVGIPYIRGVFEKVKTILQKHNVEAVGQPMNTLNHLYTKLKDKTPNELKSNLVYKVNCLDCNQEYVGETGQFVRKRLYQHRYKIRKKDISHSALVEHSVNNRHDIDWDNFKILGYEANRSKRKLLETIHIKKSDCAMNIQADSERLDNVYDSLFRR